MSRAGQWTLFMEIWSSRKHFSEISGEQLIEDFNHPKFWWQFSHVLSKGRFPAMKLSKRNIKLLTWQEHQQLTEHPEQLRELPEWKAYFEYYDKLKQEYYSQQK